MCIRRAYGIEGIVLVVGRNSRPIGDKSGPGRNWSLVPRRGKEIIRGPRRDGSVGPSRTGKYDLMHSQLEIHMISSRDPFTFSGVDLKRPRA